MVKSSHNRAQFILTIVYHERQVFFYCSNFTTRMIDVCYSTSPKNAISFGNRATDFFSPCASLPISWVRFLFLLQPATTPQSDFPKQIAASLLGVLSYLFFPFLDIKSIVHRFRIAFVAASFLLLLLLIPFGNAGSSGNKNWIEIPLIPFNIQPAEVVKLLLVLILALQFSHLETVQSRRLSAIIFTISYPVLLCATLFFVSSDLGMILLYFFIFCTMPWISGIRLRWFFLGCFALVVLAFVMWPLLPSYIQMRCLVVFDHGLDP